MASTASFATQRARLLPLIEKDLQAALGRYTPSSFASGDTPSPSSPSSHHLTPNAPAHYGMMRYHLGWADEDFQPASGPTGKRLRPLLCLIAAEACGVPAERALPAAVSLELLHNFTLIHDDIEDGDAFRHHRPTLWKLWGEPQAINAGDGMHVLAHLALLDLSKQGASAETVLYLARQFAATSLIITEGQHLDLAFERREQVAPGEYLDMIARKSAALLSCAASMGARVAEADGDSVEALAAFGFDLGMGFQIRDDVLGIWGQSESTGKPAGDLRRRKKTLPTLFAQDRANETEQERLATLFRTPDPGDDLVYDVTQLLSKYGARRHCETMVTRYSASARGHLHRLPASEARDALETLAVQLETREH